MTGCVLVVAACVSAGACGVCLGRAVMRRAPLRRSKRAKASLDVDVAGIGGPDAACVRYLVGMTKCLSLCSTTALSRGVLLRRARAKFPDRVAATGLADIVSAEGYCEAVVRLSLGCAAAGALVGAAVSNELMAVGLIVGGVLGARAPGKALGAIRRARGVSLERSLSEMLEVVALGVRSGLSFERSLSLYAAHFDDSLARECAASLRTWTTGMATRNDALRALAASYDSPLLSRTVAAISRSLRFGTSLGEVLERSATEARAQRRAHVEECVAKAPVKMMIPTGTLILPAMLLLVLGPVLLELMEGM